MKILRELWRRKLIVFGVLAVSLLVGLLLAFRPGLPPHSRQYDVSLSSADILIDTRDSQVAAFNGHGPDLPTLAARANLIGNLMTGGQLKEEIAAAAGIPAGQLVVVPPANPATPGVPAVPVRPPASRGLADADSTVLTLSADENLPILHILAQAPSEAAARQLTTATITELKQYVGSVVASQNIPSFHQLVVREFSAPVAETAVRGLPRSYAVGAFALLALLGCGAILGGSWFVRSWRQIEATESNDEPAPIDGNGHAANRRAVANANGQVTGGRAVGNGNGKSAESSESDDAVGVPRLPGSAALRFPL